MDCQLHALEMCSLNYSNGDTCGNIYVPSGVPRRSVAQNAAPGTLSAWANLVHTSSRFPASFLVREAAMTVAAPVA
jgi:hypothetical protein